MEDACLIWEKKNVNHSYKCSLHWSQVYRSLLRLFRVHKCDDLKVYSFYPSLNGIPLVTCSLLSVINSS